MKVQLRGGARARGAAPSAQEIAAMREFIRIWLKEQKKLSPAMSDFVKRFGSVIGS